MQRMKSIFFITSNRGKFEEVQALMPFVEQLDIDLPELQEIDARNIIKFKLLEALNYKKGSELIVEDTSLYMECLGGLPGPLAKWFLKTIGNNGLADIAEKFGNRRARAKTIVGYARSPEEVHFFEGMIQGTIVAPRGEFGFGWDSIFQPDGYSKTFAEMTREEKNAVSMRRIALNGLQKFMEECCK